MSAATFPASVCWNIIETSYRRGICILAGIHQGAALVPWNALGLDEQAAILRTIEAMDARDARITAAANRAGVSR